MFRHVLRVPGPPRAPFEQKPPKPPEVPEFAKTPHPVEPLPPSEEDLRKERWEVFRTTVRHMSYPEFICWEWLTKRQNLTPEVDFLFQYPVLGGKTRFGGFVLDFVFPGRGLAWFVQGLEFHYVDPQDRARDFLAKTIITGRGYDVVELFEDDLINRSEITLRAAYSGQQLSRTRQ